MEIQDWFKNKNYEEGIRIYETSAKVKTRTLATLRRGKSMRNMALLISELRKIKNQKLKPEPSPVVHAKPPPKKEPETQTKLERNQIKEESSKAYFQKIRYGELPPELKLRFRKLKDLFYDMCDLKFLANDLPDEAEEEALELQLQIEILDERKDGIWKELEHWQNFKTILPTKTDDDFSKLTPQELFLKKASLTSSIHKMKKRIDKWKTNLEQEEDKLTARKIAQQINSTEKKLQKNELNLVKVEDLL